MHCKYSVKFPIKSIAGLGQRSQPLKLPPACSSDSSAASPHFPPAPVCTVLVRGHLGTWAELDRRELDGRTGTFRVPLISVGHFMCWSIVVVGGGGGWWCWCWCWCWRWWGGGGGLMCFVCLVVYNVSLDPMNTIHTLHLMYKYINTNINIISVAYD